MEGSKRLTILDPTMAYPEGKGQMAPRLNTLDGKVVGFLANGFQHSEKILEEAERLLRLKYELKDSIRYTKSYIGEPAPREVLDELAASCDVVITSIGA